MFRESCRNIRLHYRNILLADCRTIDGTYRFSSLDLDTLLGNIDGKFVWGKQGFSQSAREVTLEGTVLTADLMNTAGAWVSASADLSAFIRNNDGVLESDNIPQTTSDSETGQSEPPPFRNFRLENSILHVDYWLKPTYAPCSIDLDSCIGNVDGQLSQGSAAFSKTSRNIDLEDTYLMAECQAESGEWITSRLELNEVLILHHDILVEATRTGKVAVVDHKAREEEEDKTQAPVEQPSEPILPPLYKNFRLENSILHVDCWLKPTYAPCSIDLDSCIGNVDGQLTEGSTAFSKTSRNIDLEDTYLMAECQAESGEWITSRLELNEVLILHHDILVEATRTGKVAVVDHKAREEEEDKTQAPVEQPLKPILPPLFENFRLVNSILHVDCWLKPTYAPCSIDLDSCIGNVDGQLTQGSAAFSKTSRNIDLEDTYLMAECQAKSGEWITSRLELNEVLILHYDILAEAARTGKVAVIDHKAREEEEDKTQVPVEQPSEPILPPPFKNFRLENSILHVDCWLKPTYAPCSIDLDSYIGNVDGQLTQGSAFSKTSRNIDLEETSLMAECQVKSGEWVTSRLELNEVLILHYDILAEAARIGKVVAIDHKFPPLIRNLSWLESLRAALQPLLRVLKQLFSLIWRPVHPAPLPS